MMEELINPAEFTEKELLKLVYRDLFNLRKDFEDYKKTNNVQTQFQELQMRVMIIENSSLNAKEERENNRKKLTTIITVATILLGLLQVALRVLIKV